MPRPRSEALVRSDSEDQLKQAIDRAVDARIREIMQGDDAIFQPYFQSRQVTHEMKRLQTVTEQAKWTYFFEDWGCKTCGTKTAPHQSLGMCPACYSKTKQRLQISLRRRAPTNKQATFVDTAKLAVEALGPSIEILKNRRDK